MSMEASGELNFSLNNNSSSSSSSSTHTPRHTHATNLVVLADWLVAWVLDENTRDEPVGVLLPCARRLEPARARAGFVRVDDARVAIAALLTAVVCTRPGRLWVAWLVKVRVVLPSQRQRDTKAGIV